jgi:hypothetical protein
MKADLVYELYSQLGSDLLPLSHNNVQNLLTF